MSGTGIVIGNFVGGATGGGAGSSAPPITPGFNPLIFKIDTSYISGSNDYALGLDSNGTYNFTVDWGDGQSNVITSYNQPEVTHTYSSAELYTITITPNAAYSVDHWSFGRRSSSIESEALVGIISFGDVYFYANEDIFYGCSNFDTVSYLAGVPTFQNTAIVDGFFFRNNSLGTTTEPDFSGWGTFTGSAENFLIGANFDPFGSARVNVNFNFTPTSLSSAFQNQILFNSPLSNWTVSSVENFSDSFNGASSFNNPLPWTFNTSGAANVLATQMFRYAFAFNQDIGSWNTNRFTNTASMFDGALVFNQDISGWNTDSVVDASYMFQGATAFNSPLSSWFTTGSLSNTGPVGGGVVGMFQGATAFNGLVSQWDTSNLTSLYQTFKDATSFNQSLNLWDVSNVTFFLETFAGATSFTGIGLPGWNTSSALNFSGMFNGASAFNQTLSRWDISSLNSAADMLTGTAISQANWDSLLNGWAAQAPNIQNGVTLSTISVIHSAGQPTASYDKLTSSPYNWTITDLGAALPPPPFEFTIDTTATEAGSSANNQYRLPLMSTGTYNFYVDWGDGTIGDQIISWNQAEATHTYATTGTYIIQILAVSPVGETPSVDHISWASQDGTTLTAANDRLKVQGIAKWGSAQIYLNEYVFSDCSNLDITTTALPNFGSKVLRSGAFNNCTSFAGNISGWGTSGSPITGDASVFYKDGGQNPNVNFNAQLTGSLFTAFASAANFNSSLSNWDISSITSISRAFENATSFNQNISTWNTSSVSNLSGTFNGATAFDQDLASWDVRNVTTATDMFTNSGLSAANWDAILIGWAAQGTGAGSLQANVTLSNINQYHGTVDAAATAAYNKLTAAPYNWNIVDLGELPTSAFEFDINTANTITGSTNADQYRLPLTSTGTYNFTVNWGDGQSNSIATWNQADATHTYASSGTYSISITGTIDHVCWSSQNGSSFSEANDRLKVLDISSWGPAVIYLSETVLYDCSNMNITDTNAPTFGDKVMRQSFFFDCENLSADLTSWGTVASPVTGSIREILSNASSFNPNLNFVFVDSSNVYRCFWFCLGFNNPLDNWNLSGSTNFVQTFSNATTFNQDISGWDVSSGVSFTNMFGNSRAFNQDISSWDMSSATAITSMFREAVAFNQPIGTWNTSSVTSMQTTFEDATAFNQNLSAWDVGSLTTATDMFTNSGISAANWDALLIGWAAQGTGAGSLQANVTLSDVNQLHGSVDSAATAAYNKLTASPYNWTIVDLGAPVVNNLLLDTTYGSNAEAAYSVRKLRNAYTGPAMQVQDTVGGSTQDIYFDANDNLDEAAIVSYGGSNDVFVVTWYDQSGNSNDATQTSSGNRPKIYDSQNGVLTDNGKPAMDFAQDKLHATFTYSVTAMALIGVGEFSNTGSRFLSQLPQGKTRDWQGDGYRLVRNNSNLVSKRSSDLSPVSATVGFQILGATYHTGSTVTTYVNGNSGTSDANSLNATYTKLLIRSNNSGPIGECMDGKMQEVLLYTSNKSAYRTDIEENIVDYFTQNTPLLDTYSGAAAAYSLRLLDSTYTGPAVQVQDTVGGATQDIGFNVFGGLDTVALDAYGGSNDVFVVTWYDQSGNSNDATQISSGNRPKIYDATTGVITENGKPVVEFDGSSNYFSFNSLASDFTGINKPLSSFSVSKSASTSLRTLFSFGSSSSNNSIRWYGTSPSANNKCAFQERDDNYSANVYIEGGLMSDQNLGTVITNGDNNRTIYIDGTLGANNTSDLDTITLDRFSIGALNRSSVSHYFNGIAQEIIIYPSDKSTDRTGIEDNINTFYEIY